jgi:hypothetical protein
MYRGDLCEKSGNNGVLLLWSLRMILKHAV